jgi:hypothetical protein
MRANKESLRELLVSGLGITGWAWSWADVAWHARCPPCAQLVADQMETVLSIERARGAALEICRWCGAERTCPAGWTTRCHLCLDERTSPEIDLDAVAVDGD